MFASLKPHYLIHKRLEIIWPSGELNEMSTTIHPHPNPHSVFPNHFNILSLTHNIPSFVVQIHLRFLLLGFPFSSHVFNFPVSLLHFASKLYNPPQSLSSLSPSKLFLYNPTVIFPLSFFIVGLQTCFTSSSSSHFPHQLFTQLRRLDPLLLI